MKRSKLFKSLFFIFLLLAVERFCHRQTEGFRLAKAATLHHYPFESLAMPHPSSLKQPFYFLGSGVQFYVFIGEDQETILKLFKHYHTGPSYRLLQKLPSFFSKPIFEKREKRMLHLFKSVQIAQDLLPNETGVFYTHLNKTENLLGKIPLYDKLKIPHQLDLDQTEFLLQKRAEPLTQRLHRLFRAGQVEEAFTNMQQLLLLIENRSKAGIKNKDGKILQNTGFWNDQPLEMDIGSYVTRVESKCANPHQKARLKAAMQLLGWIKQHYPQHLQQCRERMLIEYSL